MKVYCMVNSKGDFLAMDGGTTANWLEASKFDENGIDSRKTYLDCGFTLRSYNVVPELTESEWAITERLPIEELKLKLSELEDKYAGNLAKHKKTNGLYYVVGFTILNTNGAAEIAVQYQPYDEKNEMIFRRINHIRPAREFFDGRFEGAMFDENKK